MSNETLQSALAGRAIEDFETHVEARPNHPFAHTKVVFKDGTQWVHLVTNGVVSDHVVSAGHILYSVEPAPEIH